MRHTSADKITYAISALLLLAFPIFGNAQSSQSNARNIVTEKKHWQEFQWDKFNTSSLWRMPGWKFTNKQEENITWIRTQDFTAFRQAGQLLISIINDQSEKNHRIHFNFDGKPKQCREFLLNTSEAFGKPTENDGTQTLAFSQEHFVKLVAINHQWDIGDTRITGGCYGSQSAEEFRQDSGEITVTLFITHISRQEKLLPPINLRCSQNLTFADGTSGRPVGDIHLIINPTFKKVTNAAGGRLDSSDLEINDTQISFTREDDKNKVVGKWNINRLTGELRINMSQQGKSQATVNGSCDRIEKIEKKF